MAWAAVSTALERAGGVGGGGGGDNGVWRWAAGVDLWAGVKRERGARSTRPHLDGGDNSDRGRSRSAAASTAMTAVVAAALLAMMACAAERSIEKLLSVGAGKPMRRYL